MTEVIFATGNPNKFYEASKICERFGFSLAQQEIDIHEIQHHDAVEITKAKIASAWEAVQTPLSSMIQAGIYQHLVGFLVDI